MDIEKLILSICNRPPLWDKSAKTYNNRDMSKKLWAEVSFEMDVGVDDLKKKWSNLRDQFRKEHNRCNQPSKSGGAANHESSWRYYKLLLFLTKQAAPKRVIRNVPATTSPESQNYDDTEESPGAGLSSQPGTSNSSQPEFSKSQKHPTPNAKPIHVPATQSHLCTPYQSERLVKRQKIDDDQEYFEVEKRKRELFERRSVDKSAEDPDRNFLLSLLPYLKEVPRNRKLFVQRKLLDVFMEEENTQVHQIKQSPVSRCSSEELLVQRKLVDVFVEEENSQLAQIKQSPVSRCSSEEL